MRVMECRLSLDGKVGGGECRVQGCGLKLDVKDEAVVQIFFDMERDLDPIHSAVIRKEYLYRNIEKRVVVGMDVEIHGDGKECHRIQEDVHLAQVLHQRDGITESVSELLSDREMGDRYTAFGLRANVGNS